MAYKLITAEHIRKLTKGSDSIGTEFDFALNDVLIPAVGALFAKYCNRPNFDKAARTEYLSPQYGQRRLFVSSPPIASSPGVQLWEDTAIPRAYGNDTLKVNGTDYFVLEEQGVIEKVGCFSGGPKSIKCTYTGGYLTADAVGCPDDLMLAAVIQTKVFFDRREEYGVTGRSLEGGSISMLNVLTLSKQVTILLDSFKVYGSDA